MDSRHSGPAVAMDVAPLDARESQELGGAVQDYRVAEALLDKAIWDAQRLVESEMIWHGRRMLAIGFFSGMLVAVLAGL